MAVPQRSVYDNLLELTEELKLDIDDQVFQGSDTQIQKHLAPILRKIAIHHLATAETPAAQTFRGEHLQVSGQQYQKYLNQQAQNGAWGTDIEAVALAEALGMNIVVTSIYKDRTDATWCLHLQDQKKPSIHLYNYDNYHWSNSKNSPTIGDGNCLYNAFAKGIKELVAPKQQNSALSSNSIFQAGGTNRQVLESQMRISNAIDRAVKSHQSQAEKVIAYTKEEERIKNLPDAVKEQIASDHALALQLATEEMLKERVEIEDNADNIRSTSLRV